MGTRVHLPRATACRLAHDMLGWDVATAVFPDETTASHAVAGRKDGPPPDGGTWAVRRDETGAISDDEIDNILEQLARGRTSREPDDAPSRSKTPTPATGHAGRAGSDPESTSIFATTSRYKRVFIPRPTPFNRALTVCVLVLLALLTLLAGFTAQVMGRLVEAIRASRSHVEVVSEPMPPDGQLLDPARFAALLSERPRQACDLHLAKARVLVHRQNLVAAAEAFHAARLMAVRGLRLEDELDEVTVLIELRRFEKAEAILAGIDRKKLDDTQRQRVASLVGRLAGRQ